MRKRYRRMGNFSFTVLVDREPTDEEFDRFVDSGADDGVFGTEGGRPTVIFYREADTCADAIATAVADLLSIGLKPLRFIDEDLVTLADIADRAGRSREGIRRYSIGERGAIGFPPPVNPGGDGTIFYRWSEVAPWLREHKGIDAPDREPALAMANHIIEMRELEPRVSHADVLKEALAALPPSG